MTDQPYTCAEHAARLAQSEKDIQAIHGYMSDMSDDIKKVYTALVGDVDSDEPGMKELLRKTWEQAKKTNGRVTELESGVKKSNARIDKVWYGVWGAFISLSAMWGGFAWAVDNGLIKLGD
jgi:hypothetical protein